MINRNIGRNCLYCLMPLLLMLPVSCGNKTIKYGEAMNARREILGLPIVQNSWTQHLSANECVWVTPSSRENKAEYFSKKIAWDASGLLWEADTYYSGKKVDLKVIDPDGGEGSEEIIIHYSFDKPKQPWRCSYLSDKGLSEIDLLSAITILESWGLTHPIPIRAKADGDNTAVDHNAQAIDQLANPSSQPTTDRPRKTK